MSTGDDWMSRKQKARNVYQRSCKDWEATKFAIIVAFVFAFIITFPLYFFDIIGGLTALLIGALSLLFFTALISILLITLEESLEKDLFPKKKLKKFSKK